MVKAYCQNLCASLGKTESRIAGTAVRSLFVLINTNCLQFGVGDFSNKARFAFDLRSTGQRIRNKPRTRTSVTLEGGV